MEIDIDVELEEEAKVQVIADRIKDELGISFPLNYRNLVKLIRIVLEESK